MCLDSHFKYLNVLPKWKSILRQALSIVSAIMRSLLAQCNLGLTFAMRKNVSTLSFWVMFLVGQSDSADVPHGLANFAGMHISSRSNFSDL